MSLIKKILTVIIIVVLADLIQFGIIETIFYFEHKQYEQLQQQTIHDNQPLDSNKDEKKSEIVNDQTPQWMINNDNLLRAVGNNDLVKVQEAIKAGADVNMRRADDSTVLSLAAEQGYLDIFRELVKDGANVNGIKGGDNLTILMTIADYNDRLDIVKELIKDGADVNKKSSEGWTALRFALMNCEGDIAKELINAGADVNAKDNEGKTVLEAAYSDASNDVSCLEFINILKAAGAK
jgi:ankyrin repeat protein